MKKINDKNLPEHSDQKQPHQDKRDHTDNNIRMEGELQNLNKHPLPMPINIHIY